MSKEERTKDTSLGKIIDNWRSCARCAFWNDRGDGEEGECRVNPPVMHAQLNFKIDDIVPLEDGCWPYTKASDWCGRLQARSINGS
jgi:hypothetical protein